LFNVAWLEPCWTSSSLCGRSITPAHGLSGGGPAPDAKRCIVRGDVSVAHSCEQVPANGEASWNGFALEFSARPFSLNSISPWAVRGHEAIGSRYTSLLA
jgi:hypothetical protein